MQLRKARCMKRPLPRHARRRLSQDDHRSALLGHDGRVFLVHRPATLVDGQWLLRPTAFATSFSDGRQWLRIEGNGSGFCTNLIVAILSAAAHSSRCAR